MMKFLAVFLVLVAIMAALCAASGEQVVRRSTDDERSIVRDILMAKVPSCGTAVIAQCARQIATCPRQACIDGSASDCQACIHQVGTLCCPCLSAASGGIVVC